MVPATFSMATLVVKATAGMEAKNTVKSLDLTLFRLRVVQNGNS